MTADQKVTLNLEEIIKKMQSFSFPNVDIVVGISSGGVFPAKLVAKQLDLPLRLIYINYRNQNNQPKYAVPKFIKMEDLPQDTKKLLLVDDVSVSGKTLQYAKDHLKNFKVKTFVLKGHADYVLFPGIRSCVHWPWKSSPED
jgi:hypoxanthine phosphoribosyltransferase